MGGPFNEAPYPQLQFKDFGPRKQWRIELQNSGRTVVIGDHTDLGFQRTHTYVQPAPDALDIVIHGLPGRFIDALGGRLEISVPVVIELLDSVGVPRGTPLRLLTCHAGEAPMTGLAVAQQLSTAWGGPVNGPNGLLRIGRGQMRIDLVEWYHDPITGGMLPSLIGHQGQGSWLQHSP